MTINKQKEIFKTNLLSLLEERDLSQAEVATAINVSPQTFNTWCKGIALPRMDKIQLLADYFCVDKGFLVDDQSDNEQSYYLDPEAAAFAQEISEKPGLRALFSAARDVKEEDLRFMVEMAGRFKTESGED